MTMRSHGSICHCGKWLRIGFFSRCARPSLKKIRKWLGDRTDNGDFRNRDICLHGIKKRIKEHKWYLCGYDRFILSNVHTRWIFRLSIIRWSFGMLQLFSMFKRPLSFLIAQIRSRRKSYHEINRASTPVKVTRTNFYFQKLRIRCHSIRRNIWIVEFFKIHLPKI